MGDPMLDNQFRSSFENGIRPMGQSLQRLGVTADYLTIGGVVMSVGIAVSLAFSQLHLALFFLILAGLTDVLDGAVAKAAGTASPRGAFFDSVADRLSDALMFGGVAWYLAITRPGVMPLLAVAVLAMSMMISYERAKAESLGFDARGGLMERAERMVLLGLGLLFEVLLIPVLVVMLVLTSITAIQRFARVWRQASVTRPDVFEGRQSMGQGVGQGMGQGRWASTRARRRATPRRSVERRSTRRQTFRSWQSLRSGRR